MGWDARHFADHATQQVEVDAAETTIAVHTAQLAGVTVRTVTQAWNPPATALAVGSFVSTTVPVPNADIGDPVEAGIDVALAAGVFLTASVTSAGVVTVTLVNNTGAAVDVAAGTLRVTVLDND